MARNAEKAMTTLARWRAAKENETGERDRRPYLASECNDVRKCERYRIEIIREISQKVSQIQNAGLGEFRIRDLNDEINKLLREKRHWENQISYLGGPHYRRYGPKMLDAEGREVPGNRGYKYFGAAKDLPGVRELFEQEPPPQKRKNRGELMKDIDAAYYGYRDDEDNILIPLEAKLEHEAIEAAIAEWKEKMAREGRNVDDEPEATQHTNAAEPTQGLNDEDPMGLLAPRFKAHIPVPTQRDVEEALLRKRKQELIAKYCGGEN